MWIGNQACRLVASTHGTRGHALVLGSGGVCDMGQAADVLMVELGQLVGGTNPQLHSPKSGP